MRKLLLVLFVGLAVISCDKNQTAVKKLDGKWNTTKATLSDNTGKSLDLIALGMKVEWNFTKCKLKDEEFCDYTVTTTLNGDVNSEVGVFKVEGDGTKLVVASTKNDPISDYETMTIKELNKDNCILSASDSTGTTEFTLEKIK